MMPQYFNTPRNVLPERNNLQFAGFGQFRPRSGQSRMFTNNNNFQRPPTNQLRSNVFKSQNRQFSRDEPMDVSSGNTIINRAMNNKQNQNRNFTSQELFNQSVTNLEDQNEETFEPYVENYYSEKGNAHIPNINQFNNVNPSNDEFCSGNYEFEQSENFDESNFQILHSDNPPI